MKTRSSTYRTFVTYNNRALKNIAAAIKVDRKSVLQHRHKLEAAATWYRSDCRSPRRSPPSKLVRRLEKIEKDANRLLLALGLSNLKSASDEFVDIELFDALTLIDETDSTDTQRSCERLARLRDLILGIRAAAEMSRRAAQATRETHEVGKLITPPGHHGDRAAIDWIAAMLKTYEEMIGRKPKVSRGGPLMRFVQAAGEPLNIKYSQAAWFERLRRAQRR